MTKRRRILLIGCAVLVVVAATIVVILHSAGIQRRAWMAVTEAVEEASGIHIEAEHFRLRGLPARVVIRGLTVDIDGQTVLTAEEIRADWKWRRLAAEPRRIESILIQAPVLYGDALKPIGADQESTTTDDIWGFEVGSLEISEGRASAGAPGIRAVLEGISLQASLVGGTARAALEADALVLDRAGRQLVLEPLVLEVEASPDGVILRRMEIDSERARLFASGKLSLIPEVAGGFEFDIEADLPMVAAWWDPNMESGLAPAGRAHLIGDLGLAPDGGTTAHLVHRGAPMSLAGYDIDMFELSYTNGGSTVDVAGAGWGRAAVTIAESGVISTAAELADAPVDRMLAFAAPQIADAVRGPTVASGRLDGTFSFPLDPETIEGDVDLIIRSADGYVVVEGFGAGVEWQFERLEAHVGDVAVQAHGGIGLGGAVRLEAELTVSDPARAAATLEPLYPDIGLFEIAGGPISGTIRLEGELPAPAVDGDLIWSQPEILGRRLGEISVHGVGDMEAVSWQIAIDIDGDSDFQATGTAQPRAYLAAGNWEVEIPDVADLAEVLAPGTGLAGSGRFAGSGSFEWSAEGYRVDGRADGRDLETETFSVQRLETEFVIQAGTVAIENLRVEAFDGVIEGSLRAPLAEFDGQIDGRLGWHGIDMAGLPVEVPEALSGLLSGEASFGGTISRPEGTISAAWDAVQPQPVADRLQVHADLTDGIVTAELVETATRAGTLSVRATVPLGDIVRPSWLWPQAPGGTATAHLEANGFSFGPVAEMFDIVTAGADAFATLEADVEWNPHTPDLPEIRASVLDLRFVHPTGELVADGPVEVRIDGRKIQVEPVALVGFNSRINFEASYDPAADSVEGRFNAEITEDLARLVPIPVSVRGSLFADAEIHIPVSEALSLESVSGSLSLDHREGELVMRDPPVEIRQLKLEARLENGKIDIVDGTAEVNRGEVLVGGGWDPKSRQGIVFELDDVTLFAQGILTKWDGALVVEPRPGELAHVAGDLELVAGLWDEAFDITSAFFGTADAGLAADDPLHDITLDLSVRGRSGVKVDNNLGHFDVAWDVLRIGGTAATPRINGTVRIAPGGVIGIGGREIKVRRGTLDFTGDPAIDPIMEIVPESDMTLIGGGGEGNAIDPTLLATRGLAQGISSVLGFENETLRPAQIAGQIERDPSVNFIIGQRLNRNLALFVSANLTDVQDRLTMLQSWNFRALPGLVAQLYQETSTDSAGANLLQQFSWGGASTGLERPEIYRLKLEGDWPISKRRLKKATGLRRGQPFDPFFLFVASVRMERALAENGYQSARVTAFQEGEDRSPTLVFYCEPGKPQFFRFDGGSLPKHLRGEVTSLYESPPLETAAFDEMEVLVTRYLALQGYPEAEVSVERAEELIVVDTRRGEETEMRGPVFEGLPPEIAVSLAAQMGSATVVAAQARRPESLARAVEQRLAAFGFLEAKVESVDVVHLDPSTTEVRIDVESGPRETIEGIELVGSDPLDLIGGGKSGLHVGQPLDRDSVDAAVRNLRNAYIGAGYREVSARSEFRRTADDRWVVEIQLEPGNLRRLREVRISGLKHVSRNVVQKGLEIDDGEIVVDRDIDRSASQIANFSPIERVEVRTTDVGTSEVDVDFEVAEKDRWAAEIGGGWSTERGASATFGLRDDDLFGRGIGLNLRGGWGSTEKKMLLIGSVPPVPGGRLSLISTIGYSSGDAPEDPEALAQEEELASLEALYSLTNRVQVGVYYRWTDTRVYEKEPDPFDPFPFDSRDRLGTIGVRTIIDRFDNLFDPRRGWSLTSDLGWTAEAFGSDVNYLSWLNNFSLAVTPYAGATWLQTARVGVAEPLKGEALIRSARFFAGGQASIRGFDLDSVGPVTLGFQGTLVPAGGGALFILNEELRIPVWGALRLAAFADIGQVWPSWSEADFNLVVGAGVGIRWSTPIGPLWADVAWPVADVGISSKKMKFYLGIGRPF